MIYENNSYGFEEKKETKNAGLRIEASSFIPAKVREEMERLAAEDALFLKEENEMREREWSSRRRNGKKQKNTG